MITIRLDQKLEQQIENTAKNLGLSKSELIRKSINEYLSKLKQPNAWDIGEDLFGKYSSGLGNLSSDRKELIKNTIKAKRT
ncbi:transcriptional regulator [Desulfomarina profundi]|uniref:Transcriptional regulator n=1 Tax=Desulfomarina profundi TaxID=2772557 RepID=A0A8D5FQT6_9BACT|nr:ribbon-helix-helix domain-containing protein [Desulfomarina profundi]BCL60069.1 transcriptional regulator [Desulfomarina profundi]